MCAPHHALSAGFLAHAGTWSRPGWVSGRATFCRVGLTPVAAPGRLCCCRGASGPAFAAPYDCRTRRGAPPRTLLQSSDAQKLQIAVSFQERPLVLPTPDAMGKVDCLPRTSGRISGKAASDVLRCLIFESEPFCPHTRKCVREGDASQGGRCVSSQTCASGRTPGGRRDGSPL